MISFKSALGLALLAMLVMVAESSWGNEKGNSYNYEPSTMSKLIRLYLSKVYKAERLTRPLGHSGVRVTLKDGTKWLVHKGDDYGISSETDVVDARHMSISWKVVEVKNFCGSKTVYDFVKAGETEDFKFLFDRCRCLDDEWFNAQLLM